MRANFINSASMKSPIKNRIISHVAVFFFFVGFLPLNQSTFFLICSLPKARAAPENIEVIFCVFIHLSSGVYGDSPVSI